MSSLRITDATVDVLESLLGADEPSWGLAVVKHSGRPAGTVYPVLERLERAGWLESEWETDTDRPGPRRRLYRLTDTGRTAASRAIAHRVASRRATSAVRAASGVAHPGGGLA
ncbi:PadR family transcriptional regulator [Agromyces mediolanus]|uniref:PadR family transcriptional regulator n=1 Tax=Agromyces mediolanus TaxID=41986 RepID=UPI00203B4A5B|nr:PadR family transcriptional regulator [Agromyces mediolanus]MCM3656109.1 PadR family transcriptional regulator [Agromyces mediolanus]